MSDDVYRFEVYREGEWITKPFDSTMSLETARNVFAENEEDAWRIVEDVTGETIESGGEIDDTWKKWKRLDRRVAERLDDVGHFVLYQTDPSLYWCDVDTVEEVLEVEVPARWPRYSERSEEMSRVLQEMPESVLVPRTGSVDWPSDHRLAIRQGDECWRVGYLASYYAGSIRENWECDSTHSELEKAVVSAAVSVWESDLTSPDDVDSDHTEIYSE